MVILIWRRMTDYFDNKLAEDVYNESEVNKALEALPKVA